MPMMDLAAAATASWMESNCAADALALVSRAAAFFLRLSTFAGLTVALVTAADGSARMNSPRMGAGFFCVAKSLSQRKTLPERCKQTLTMSTEMQHHCIPDDRTTMSIAQSA